MLSLYLLKPAFTFLIIMLALNRFQKNPSNYAKNIALGMVFAQAGDLILMFPGPERFTGALLCFTMTHLLYFRAFLGANKPIPSLRILPYILLSVISSILLVRMEFVLGIAIFLYILVICAMGWQAREHYFRSPSKYSLLGLIGSLFYICSDFLLGWHLMRGGIPGALYLILGLYFIAQYLLALSIPSPQKDSEA
jgi:uncharacterized membrane protein YhhN